MYKIFWISVFGSSTLIPYGALIPIICAFMFEIGYEGYGFLCLASLKAGAAFGQIIYPRVIVKMGIRSLLILGAFLSTLFSVSLFVTVINVRDTYDS
jgi:hypothetical protein